MAKIIVLGSGLVGSVMAKDLSNQHDVTVADISNKSLESDFLLVMLEIKKDYIEL